MNKETSYFLSQIISFKKDFYVFLGNNFLLFLWRPPSCRGPGQLPSLSSLKSGPGAGRNTRVLSDAAQGKRASQPCRRRRQH